MENYLAVQHLLPGSLCVCGIKAVPLYSALLGNWRTVGSLRFLTSVQMRDVWLRSMRVCIILMKAPRVTVLTWSTILCCVEEKESMLSFWEGETSGKEEQWRPFACGSNLLCVIFCSSLTLMCEHFTECTFQLERAVKTGLYAPPWIVFKPGI